MHEDLYGYVAYVLFPWHLQKRSRHCCRIDAGHVAEDQTYLHAVGQALAEFDFVLVAGPANAKLELMKHIARHDPQLMTKVTAVQAADHPTDGQLLDLGRRHFLLNDGASAGRSLLQVRG